MKLAYIYFNKLNENDANVNGTLNIVNALAKEVDTTFISSWLSHSNMQERLNFFLLEKHFTHHRVPVKLIDHSFWLEKISRMVYSLFVLIHLKTTPYSVIYTRDFSFIYFLSYLPASLRPKQPIFYEPHKIYHVTTHKVTREQEDRALHIPAYFMPKSNKIAEDLIRLFRIKKERICTLPNAVNLSNFTNSMTGKNDLKSSLGLPDKNIIIVYIGSFKAWKGVDTLVQSIKYTNKKNFTVLLIGGKGSDRVNVNHLIKEEGVTEKVVIMDYLPQKDIIRILKNSDIAILPNNMEAEYEYTSPLKMFEYMASGLPIVASNISSIKEILISGRNCLFFKSGNPQDLALMLDRLIADPKERQGIGSNNIHDIRNFTWENRAKAIIQAIINFNRQDVTNWFM